MNNNDIDAIVAQASQETGVAIEQWERLYPGTIVVYALAKNVHERIKLMQVLRTRLPYGVAIEEGLAAAHPYRSPAPREEEPLPRMTDKALTDTANRYGLDRKFGDDDDALRERIKAGMMPAATFCGIPFPQTFGSQWSELFGQQVQAMQEADELRARANMYGVELDPGETIEGLRERVEAYLAGDDRAKDPRVWQEERTRRARRRADAEKLAALHGRSVESIEAEIEQTERETAMRRAGATPEEAMQAIGVAMNSAPKDGIVEVQVWQHAQRGAQVMREMTEWADREIAIGICGRPEDPKAIRAENRRVGEEIASNPPEWAYPLAWRLAVMAAIEERNAESNPPPMSPQHLAAIGEWLRVYHTARLDGCLPERATERTINDMPSVCEYIALLCQAYERGRPGPGGVRVVRPA